jgi:hypothetical protein
VAALDTCKGIKSLFKHIDECKGGNVTFGDGSWSQVKGMGKIEIPSLHLLHDVLYVEGLCDAPPFTKRHKWLYLISHVTLLHQRKSHSGKYFSFKKLRNITHQSWLNYLKMNNYE